MEKRIKELEKNLKEKNEPLLREESLVGDFVSSLIPGFGKIVKALEKTSPEFRQRIAETDSEIKHRLETGWSDKKTSISYGVSIRPLDIRPTNIPIRETLIKETPIRETTRGTYKTKVKEVRIESPEIEPIFDVFGEENYISVIAEIPDASEEDIETKLEGNKLRISAGLYSKIVILPSEVEAITKRSFKNGVLQLKLKRRENTD
jgi:HSP20 family protein